MANYLVNCSPTKALDNMTPYEAWNGSKPSLHYLQCFGCDAYLYVPAAKCTKLQAKSHCCTILGYIHNTTKIWRLWDPIQKSIINASNVTFNKNSFLALGKPAWLEVLHFWPASSLSPQLILLTLRPASLNS